MAEAMSPVDILSRARELLAQPGVWAKGRAVTGGRHCAMGAIGTVSPSFRLAQAARRLFQKRNRIGNIVIWNDHRARTKKQVLAAFSRAIEIAKQGY